MIQSVPVLRGPRCIRDLCRESHGARRPEMVIRAREAGRRVKLTNRSISDEARSDAILTANSAAAPYQQEVADRSTSQLNLDRTVERVPVSGVVSNLTLDVAQHALVGTRVMTLIDSNTHRFTAYFEETKIPGVKRGQQIDIYLMSRGSPLCGHIDSISHGITDRDDRAGPELPPDATPAFDWVRLAQRIPVPIDIDELPKDELISSGMTCTVVVQEPARMTESMRRRGE